MAPRSVLIVGAGLAGSRCAETLRAEGFDGRIVIVGDEPMPPYERPALSKEFLAWERQTESLHLRPDSFWAEHEIELVLGRRVLSIEHRGPLRRLRRRPSYGYSCGGVLRRIHGPSSRGRPQ
jgi:3-phenylpropionate/trans-cinnamate dioxygenase ferredoxin reductase component